MYKVKFVDIDILHTNVVNDVKGIMAVVYTGCL